MVTRILSLCVCLLLFCAIAGLGLAQAAHPGPPNMCAPLKVQAPGPPTPLFAPGAGMCGPPMAGCPPPCPPPSCGPIGCAPPDCGPGWLSGFNPLCGILSIVTAPFRLLANCVAGDKSCQPLPPPCPPMTCAPMMPQCGPAPCPPPVMKVKPKGMQRAAYGYPPMMGQPMMMGQ